MLTDHMRAALAAAPKVDLAGRDINRCVLADPVLIPRLDEWTDPENYALGPGWSPVYSESNGIRTQLKPHVRCICGNWTGIGLHHVHADGTVNASFFDATAEQLAGMGDRWKGHPGGCGWHVFIKLADYAQGDFPPEK